MPVLCPRHHHCRQGSAAPARCAPLQHCPAGTDVPKGGGFGLSIDAGGAGVDTTRPLSN